MANGTCSVDGCRKPIKRRSWCSMHYARWLKFGDVNASLLQRFPAGTSTEERLSLIGWTVVQRRADLGPCWEWKGKRDARGYGRLGDERTHRLAFRTWNGPLGDGYEVCHRCDNPPCLAPDHLFAGTHADNLGDMHAKRRDRNGERHPDAKLTDAQVAEIRAAYVTGRWKQRELGERYGTTQAHVSMLVRGLRRARPTNPLPE